jgi:hypothetical protein
LRTSLVKQAALEKENTDLREKIASMERDKEIEVLAEEMEAKSLNAELTFDEKIAHIRQHSNLGNIREAVKMASAGNVRIASVTEEAGRGLLDPFTSFCIGGE